jgi:hypothetical protein
VNGVQIPRPNFKFHPVYKGLLSGLVYEWTEDTWSESTKVEPLNQFRLSPKENILFGFSHLNRTLNPLPRSFEGYFLRSLEERGRGRDVEYLEALLDTAADSRRPRLPSRLL